MAKPKSPESTYLTQRQKFIDAAREHGASEDADAFRGVVRKVAKAAGAKTKKGVKPKG